MTSVTVAGGSFEAPRRMRRAKRVPLTGRQETWLRYGVGVSIAALLTANGVTLASMLADEARDLPGRARGSNPSATAATTATGATVNEAPAAAGGGFPALEIPDGSIAPAPAPVSTLARDGTGSPPASPASSAAPEPSSPAVAVAPVGSATLPPPPGGDTGAARDVVPPAPPSTPPPADVPATDPSLVGQLVDVVGVVPVVGAPLGDAVAPVVEQVEPVVEDQVLAPVTGVLPAPLGDGLDSVLGGIL